MATAPSPAAPHGDADAPTATSGIVRDKENHICSVMTATDVTLHINPAVLEGVHHPSERAALVFTDALHAAEEYYRLFFTNVRELEANLRRRREANQASGAPVVPDDVLDSGLEWVRAAPGGSSDDEDEAASASGADGRSQAQRRHRHRHLRMLHVRNTPYHTFFPPPISGRHSRAIVRSLLQGRTPQPFSEWVWSKSSGQSYPKASSEARPAKAAPETVPKPTTSAAPTQCHAPSTMTVTTTADNHSAPLAAQPHAGLDDVATTAASTLPPPPPTPHHHHHHSHPPQGAVDKSMTDVTSLGSGSEPETEEDPHPAVDVSSLGSPPGEPTTTATTTTTTTQSAVASSSAPSSAPQPPALAVPLGAPTLPERARSDMNLVNAVRTHTSTRSRVESRYDRYDALAQAQASRPLTTGPTGAGPRGTLPLGHLPDLLKVSPTTAAEEHQALARRAHSGPSTRLVTPVGRGPTELSVPPSGAVAGAVATAGTGASNSAAATTTTTTTASATASKTSGAVDAHGATALSDSTSGQSGSALCPSCAVSPTTHTFDVAAINAMEDPLERARCMSQVYEAVLESCKDAWVPEEPPSSPLSDTSPQMPSTSFRGLNMSMADPVNAPFFSSSFIGENETTYTIPTSQQGPEYFTQTGDGRKPIIIIMVGLPARGKTFLAQKICRLLGWHGTKAKVHNVQVAWRRVLLDYEATQCRIAESLTHHKSPSPSPASDTPAVSSSPAAAVKSTETSPCASMAPHISSPSNTTTRDFPVCDTAITPAVSGVNACRPTTPPRARPPPAYAPTHTGAPFVPAHVAPCLTADHFRQLLLDPESAARRLYRYVLRGFAEDCRVFFESGGEVVVINDDFVTEELRLEAEALFQPYASQLFYMEVQRDEDRNKTFNDCKISDPTEYPHDAIPSFSPKRDFEARMRLLQDLYETLDPREADHDVEDDEDDVLQDDDDDGQNGGSAVAGASPTTSASPQSRRALNALRRAVRRQHRLRYIKITNSSTMETHGISGYTASNIVSYVLNLSQVKMQHPIYFVRHGESCFNLEDRIGGDPLLTDQGMRDGAALLEFLSSLKAHLIAVDDAETTKRTDAHGAAPGTNPPAHLNADKLEIWTSQLRRAIQTAELSERLLDIKTLRWSSLNEIHAGVCEDMTYAEVKKEYPLIDHFRKQSKYTYRYPDGESYQDLVVRLEPVIMELENADKAVVVVAHQAVLRCLLAYFGSVSAESSVWMKVPHRTVWRCTYDSKGLASLEELVLKNTDAGFRRTQRLPGVDDSLFISEENIHVEHSPAQPH